MKSNPKPAVRAPASHIIRPSLTTAERDDLATLLPILSRPRGTYSDSAYAFARDVLEPVFGPPLRPCGTYALRIGTAPTVAFTAHFDTVDMSKVQFAETTRSLFLSASGVLTLGSSVDRMAVLGADDGAGVWLILEMIRAGVPGVYLVFDAEDHGLIGSGMFAEQEQEVMSGVSKVISFDRHIHNGNQVITHMTGCRTASDMFARALCQMLQLGYKESSRGSITDSLALADMPGVCEVTNISVGYRDHHDRKESLDFFGLRLLRHKLVRADWESLPEGHNPVARSRYSSYETSNYGYSEVDELADLIRAYPTKTAEFLVREGINADALLEELGLYDTTLPRGIFRGH